MANEKLFSDVVFYVVDEADKSAVQLLKDHGAKEDDYLAGFVTHCISESNEPDECNEARTIWDVPVVQSRWASESLSADKQLPPKAFDPENALFFGFTFAFTQLSKDDIQRLWAVSVFHGATVEPKLATDCTHLISGVNIENSDLLRSHPNIKIVSPEWITNSVQKKSVEDEDSYTFANYVTETKISPAVDEVEMMDTSDDVSASQPNEMAIESPAHDNNQQTSSNQVSIPTPQAQLQTSNDQVTALQRTCLQPQQTTQAHSYETQQRQMQSLHYQQQQIIHQQQMNQGLSRMSTPARSTTLDMQQQQQREMSVSHSNLPQRMPLPVQQQQQFAPDSSNASGSGIQVPQGAESAQANFQQQARFNVSGNAQQPMIRPPAAATTSKKRPKSPRSSPKGAKKSKEAKHAQPPKTVSGFQDAAQGLEDLILKHGLQSDITKQTIMRMQMSGQISAPQLQKLIQEHIGNLPVDPSTARDFSAYNPQYPITGGRLQAPQQTQLVGTGPVVPQAQSGDLYNQQSAEQHVQEIMATIVRSGCGSTASAGTPTVGQIATTTGGLPSSSVEDSRNLRLPYPSAAFPTQTSTIQQSDLNQQRHPQAMPPQSMLRSFPVRPNLPQGQDSAGVSVTRATANVSLPAPTTQSHSGPGRPKQSAGNAPHKRMPPAEFCLLGCSFYFAGYGSCLTDEMAAKWKERIEQKGGLVVKDYTPDTVDKITHVLCSSRQCEIFTKALNDRKRVATAYWLNDIILKKHLQSPWLPLHLPTALPTTKPKELTSQIIGMTGFQGEERAVIRRLIGCIGASFTNYLSRHNTVLVCKRPTGLKYDKAKEWNIIRVNPLWLVDIYMGQLDALKLPLKQQYSTFNHVSLGLDHNRPSIATTFSPWTVTFELSDNDWNRLEELQQRSVVPDYDKVLVSAEQRQPRSEQLGDKPAIMFTGIDKRRIGHFEKIVVELGGILTPQSHLCTHLVAPRVLRTVKFFTAISVVQYIVTPQWLEDSKEAGSFLGRPLVLGWKTIREATAEKPYCLVSKPSDSTHSVNITQSLTRAKKRKVFEGMTFYITPSVTPAPHIIREVLQNGGGNVLRQRPRLHLYADLQQMQMVVISCPRDYILCSEFIHRQIPIYGPEFVFSAALHQQLDMNIHRFDIPDSVVTA